MSSIISHQGNEVKTTWGVTARPQEQARAVVTTPEEGGTQETGRESKMVQPLWGTSVTFSKN